MYHKTRAITMPCVCSKLLDEHLRNLNSLCSEQRGVSVVVLDVDVATVVAHEGFQQRDMVVGYGSMDWSVFFFIS